MARPLTMFTGYIENTVLEMSISKYYLYKVMQSDALDKCT